MSFIGTAEDATVTCEDTTKISTTIMISKMSNLLHRLDLA